MVEATLPIASILRDANWIAGRERQREQDDRYFSESAVRSISNQKRRNLLETNNSSSKNFNNIISSNSSIRGFPNPTIGNSPNQTPISWR
mmetsp:Transcript_26615/g.73226  ORF Transcript_26615/g.73226 Transcript_26615/m.73226 type:complete len:90 (+) Transcript_26615:320-589(+)